MKSSYRNKSGFASATIVLILGVVVFAGIAVYLLVLNKTNNTGTTPISSDSNKGNTNNHENPSPTASVKQNDISSPIKYVSKTLGISFEYLPTQSYDAKTYIKEVGNKIYVYAVGNAYGNTDPNRYEDGQFVEVFSKDKNKSLKEALQDRFLTGAYAQYCQVDEDTIGFGNKSTPKTYVKANINLKNRENVSNVDDLYEKLKNCPDPYTQRNGVSYFLADTEHPDKFLFFSIGQYQIDASKEGDGSLGWQDTIEFLDRP